MATEPRPYDMYKKEERLRWFREMYGYLKTEDFIHQGTDIEGRAFALVAFHKLWEIEKDAKED
jgi:hypothetical protein